MIKFSNESWHYLLLKYLSPFEPDKITNICQLISRLFITICIVWVGALLGVSLILGFGAVVLTILFVDILRLFGHPYNKEWLGMITAINLLGLICIVVSSLQFLGRLWRNRKRSYKVKQPGVIRTYWKSLKDKTCILVKYG